MFDILSTPQVSKKTVKIVETPIERIENYDEKNNDRSDSFEFEFEVEKEKNVKYVPRRKNTVTSIRQYDEKKGLDKKVRKIS